MQMLNPCAHVGSLSVGICISARSLYVFAITPYLRVAVEGRLSTKTKMELAAPTRTPAAHALIATTIPDHDRAADVAGGRVSQVDHSGEGVGGMDMTRRSSLVVGRWQRRRTSRTWSSVQIPSLRLRAGC